MSEPKYDKIESTYLTIDLSSERTVEDAIIAGLRGHIFTLTSQIQYTNEMIDKMDADYAEQRGKLVDKIVRWNKESEEAEAVISQTEEIARMRQSACIGANKDGFVYLTDGRAVPLEWILEESNATLTVLADRYEAENKVKKLDGK